MKDMVFRTLFALFSLDIDHLVNRTGDGKMRLHDSISNAVAGAVLAVFPACSRHHVDSAISRFFKNANDRKAKRELRNKDKANDGDLSPSSRRRL